MPDTACYTITGIMLHYQGSLTVASVSYKWLLILLLKAAGLVWQWATFEGDLANFPPTMLEFRMVVNSLY